jgi:hypothetical protein
MNNRTPNKIEKPTVPQGTTATTITDEVACERASSKASAKS